jgi:hypothetical protein
VPAEHVTEAVRQGFRVETPSQRAVRDYIGQNEGLRGTLKVGLGQMADEAALGLPELILDHTQDPLEVAKREALKKEHNLANTAGGIAGFVASLFVGGPLWKGAGKAGAVVAEHVAEKLATTTAGEVGARTVKSVAGDVLRNMTAKAAGSATEGAIVMAPHAITEAALGDPEQAGETLLAGAGIGSLFGAGGALAKDFFKLGKEAVTKGAELASGQEQNAKTVARKIAKVLTGVNEDDILHYVENPERVNAAPAREEIMDAIDGAYNRHKTEVDLAKENLGVAKKELDEAYHATRFDLARARPEDSVATDVMAALDREKGVLGTLSEQAEDALERSGVTTTRQHVLGFLDNVIGAIGTEGERGERILVSNEEEAAVRNLQAQRERVASFGQTITAPQLRGIMRGVRKDINFNMMAGEFNDTANKARKKFSEGLSDFLKGQGEAAERAGITDVPELREYASYMARMRDLSSTLEDMSKAFGTRERAVNSIAAAVKGATGGGRIKDELLEKFSGLTGQDFIGQLDQAKQARELLELSQRQDMRATLTPNLHAKVESLQQDVARLEAEFEPVKRLTPDRTQNIIRQQGFKTASVKDRRALEVLGQKNDTDFLQLIKDRNVLDAFSKESTNGSRKTLLGALVGGLAGGGPVGATIGGAVGASADVYGGVLLKKLIDASGDKAGLLFAERAMKHAAEKLDAVPELLRNMSMASRARDTARPASTYAVYRLLNGRDPESKKTEAARPARIDRLRELNEKTSVLAADPASAADKVSALTSAVSGRGAPTIGEAFSQKMLGGLDYLRRTMPRPPRPTSPFAPKAVWKPSDFELSAFEQKVQVVHDPFSVLTELEHGTLTRNHMDALKAVFPMLHALMQRKVQDAVVSGVEPMAYNQRVKLSLLMDAPMDTSLESRSVAYYQQVFANADQTQEPQPQGQKLKVDIAGDMMSDSDRLASRRA